MVVQELLQSGYRKVDARNPQGLSALHLACLTGNEAIVKELLAAGAKVKVRDSEGLSPLHVSISLVKVKIGKKNLVTFSKPRQLRTLCSRALPLNRRFVSS